MSRSLFFTLAMVLSNYGISEAASSRTYGLVQEWSYVLAAVSSLILAVLIYKALKGGSLDMPWVFFTVGFFLAAANGVINLLDINQLLLHQYDIRLATLVTRVGSMLFMLVGFYLYKQRLE